MVVLTYDNFELCSVVPTLLVPSDLRQDPFSGALEPASFLHLAR